MFSLKQYINGELVEGKGSPISVVCPGTGEVIGEVKAVSAEQAQQALEAARDAFPAWSALPLEARVAWLLKLAAAGDEEKESWPNHGLRNGQVLSALLRRSERD
jgi:acyl-CoA reductase-like NAD-dependent aldehyde dehydrogenase